MKLRLASEACKQNFFFFFAKISKVVKNIGIRTSELEEKFTFQNKNIYS